MIDNSYNRAKMRGYVKGLRRALVHIHGDGDNDTSLEDIKAEITKIEKDWNIKPDRKAA